MVLAQAGVAAVAQHALQQRGAHHGAGRLRHHVADELLDAVAGGLARDEQVPGHGGVDVAGEGDVADGEGQGGDGEACGSGQQHSVWRLV